MLKVTTKLFPKLNLALTSGLLRKHGVWTGNKVLISPFKSVEVPDSTLYDYVWKNLGKWPDKIATVCAVTNRSYTYAQMYKQTQIFGANLRSKLKIQDGDTVAVMLPNMPEFPTVVFGILAAGGIVTTVNPGYTAYEVQRQLILSEAKLLIIHPDVSSTAKQALKLCQKDIPIISLDFNLRLHCNTISFKELVEHRHVDTSVLKEVKRRPEDVALLPYSSGTTGLPKGVELTNRNIVANFEQQNTECRIFNSTSESYQDSTLGLLPMFHAYGLLLVALHKMSAGLKIVVLPKFNPETFVNTLEDFSIKLLYLAPPLVLFLASNTLATQESLAHVNCVISGAAPVSTADIQNFRKKLRHDAHFGQGYGLTETGPLATISPLGFNEWTTVGFPIPNVEMRIVDENMNNLGDDEVGELLIRGPNVMKGYKNNPQANQEAFLPDGWFRTGDMASVQPNGAVVIKDRLKELIKVNANQVAPAELENLIKDHPAVLDVAVVGIPDPTAGERPRAFVVLKPGAKTTQDDIKDFVSGRVAKFKRVKDVVFIEAIPKNPSGKILRKVLREQFC